VTSCSASSSSVSTARPCSRSAEWVHTAVRRDQRAEPGVRVDPHGVHLRRVRLTGRSSNIWIAMAVGAASGRGSHCCSATSWSGLPAARRHRIRDRDVDHRDQPHGPVRSRAIQGPFILAYTASTHSTMNIGACPQQGPADDDHRRRRGDGGGPLCCCGRPSSASRCGPRRRTSRSPGLPASPRRWTRAVAWLLRCALRLICGVLLGIGRARSPRRPGAISSSRSRPPRCFGGIGKPYGAMLGALLIGIMSQAAAAVISPSTDDRPPGSS